MSDVRLVFTKWGGLAHWEYDATLLGEDRHGVWLGLRAGALVGRPGAQFHTKEDQVVLLPDAAYVATFFAPGGTVPCDTYVDIATPPTRDGDVFRAVDLDLDVLRGWTGRVWVDDEDEFADHRVRYGYPPAVVDLAVRTCEEVRRAVEEHAGPFDQATPRAWLSRMSETVP